MQQPDQMHALLDQIRRDPGLVERLPSDEGTIVRAALAGHGVHAIAADCQTSEANVWHVMGRVARQATGSPAAQVESGGLGSLGDEPDYSLPGGPAAGGRLDNVSDA